MKLIEAVINKLKLYEVRCALDQIGVDDFSESTIMCHGHNQGRKMVFRGATFANAVEKVKLEIVSADESADMIIRAIGSITGMGSRDDCRISIRPYMEMT